MPTTKKKVPTRQDLARVLDERLDDSGILDGGPTTVGGVAVRLGRVVGHYSQGGSGIGGCQREEWVYVLDEAPLRLAIPSWFRDERGNHQSLDSWEFEGRERVQLATVDQIRRVAEGILEAKERGEKAKMEAARLLGMEDE
jgi:hypothetical protein